RHARRGGRGPAGAPPKKAGGRLPPPPRRLPSTTIEDAVCAAASCAVKTETAVEPSTVPPRTTHTTASPRSIPTQGFIRYAPPFVFGRPAGDRRILPPGLYGLFPAFQPSSPVLS